MCSAISETWKVGEYKYLQGICSQKNQIYAHEKNQDSCTDQNKYAFQDYVYNYHDSLQFLFWHHLWFITEQMHNNIGISFLNRKQWENQSDLWIYNKMREGIEITGVQIASHDNPD